MNRYLIAALYVMAGCVVAVPLKVQGNAESMRGERGRLIITTTVKVISNYVEEQAVEKLVFDLAPEYFWSPDIAVHEIYFSFAYPILEKIQPPCYTSHKIRAPEYIEG